MNVTMGAKLRSEFRTPQIGPALQFLMAALTVGTIAGLVRMSQGAHFLSDVSAGVAMAAVVAVFQLIFQAVEHNGARRSAEAAGTRTRS